MRLFVGRPRFTHITARAIWIVGMFAVLWGYTWWMSEAFRHPPLVWLVTDKGRYRQLRQDVAKWDQIAREDSAEIVRSTQHKLWAEQQRVAAQQTLTDWLASGIRDTTGGSH